MKKILVLYFVIILFNTSCFTTFDDLKRITKLNIENVKVLTASEIEFDLIVVDLSDIENKKFGICYSSLNSQPLIFDSIIELPNLEKGVHKDTRVSGFKENTKYFYRVYCIEDGGIVYSKVEEFKTYSLPKIQQVTNITYNSANINIVFNEVSGFAIAYGRNTKDMTLSDVYLSSTKSMSTIVIKDLIPNSKYYFYVIQELNGYSNITDIHYFNTEYLKDILVIDTVYNNKIWAWGNCKNNISYKYVIRGVIVAEDRLFKQRTTVTSITSVNEHSFNFHTSLKENKTYYLKTFLEINKEKSNILVIDTILYSEIKIIKN